MKKSETNTFTDLKNQALDSSFITRNFFVKKKCIIAIYDRKDNFVTAWKNPEEMALELFGEINESTIQRCYNRLYSAMKRNPQSPTLDYSPQRKICKIFIYEWTKKDEEDYRRIGDFIDSLTAESLNNSLITIKEGKHD